MYRPARGFILLAFGLWVSGCAGFIPAQLQEKIQREVSLKHLQQDPKIHTGQLVLLGGEILDLKGSANEGTVEVLQRPLDAWDRPDLAAESVGRFVVKLSKEATLEGGYSEGQPLTVVGEVTGEIERRAGRDIPSPILVAKYLRLWSPGDYARRSPPSYYCNYPYAYHPLLIHRHSRLGGPCW
jgi:starvation-inducible outer membrane lipoprotein